VTENTKALGDALLGNVQFSFTDEREKATRGILRDLEDAGYTIVRASPSVLDIIEDHWPDIAAAGDDSTWLECSCGWDSSVKGAVDWHQHLVNAVEDALGLEPA
jgi:Holliday junction resolvase